MNLFLNFTLYAATGLALLFAGFVVFELTTKTKELKLISNGNTSAALSLGGRLFGLSFVIGSSIANSLSLIDLLIWGTVGIAAQIIALFAAEHLAIRSSISKAIDADNKAVGLLVMFLSLSVGWVIAQCLTY
jgi:putative membrane protein